MPQPDTRNQHYVARQHLRGFSPSNDDMVCAFSKEGRSIVSPIHVGKVCSENWFYETEIWPTNHFEKVVTHPVEAKFWPFLKRVIDGDLRPISQNV